MRVSRRKFVAGMGSVIFFSAPLGSALAATTEKKTNPLCHDPR